MGPKAKDERRAERGGFLLTHKGYSVPSVLDLSHHVVKALERGEASPGVRANWTGEGRNEWEERLLSGGAAQVGF